LLIKLEAPDKHVTFDTMGSSPTNIQTRLQTAGCSTQNKILYRKKMKHSRAPNVLFLQSSLMSGGNELPDISLPAKFEKRIPTMYMY
jgi:hypothetical protein